MNQANRKIVTNGRTVVFCLLVAAGFIMVFGTIRSISIDQMSGKNLLHQIRTDTLTYRLIQMESLLSHEKRDRDEYTVEMQSIVMQLQQKLKAVRPMLTTNTEQAALAAFDSDWRAYLKESSSLNVSSKGQSDLNVLAAIARKSSVLFENAAHSLDALMDTHAKAPETWSHFMKLFFKENRISLPVLYIFGAASFLIIACNLFLRKVSRHNSAEGSR